MHEIGPKDDFWRETLSWWIQPFEFPVVLRARCPKRGAVIGLHVGGTKLTCDTPSSLSLVQVKDYAGTPGSGGPSIRSGHNR